MRGKNRKPIASCLKLPQFTTMNVIDGQAGLIIYASLIFYSLTIDNILNIIVLLILAAVSIATLTGENGILTQATKAGERTTEETEKEEIKLSYNAAKSKKYEEGDYTGEITAKNLEDELKKQNPKVQVKEDSNPIEVTFPNGDVYTVDGKTGEIEKSNTGKTPPPTEDEPITMEDAKKKAKFDTKTKVKDTLGNIVVVPEGFKIAEDSASDVTGGVVIEDVENTETLGSQFVWIPVGEIKKSSGTETITLSRYTFSDGTDSKAKGTSIEQGQTAIESGSNNYTENLDGNGKTKNAVADTEVFNAFTNTLEEGSNRKSVQEVGGYYIGRYEARNGSEETERDNKENPLTQITENPNHNVYNYVTQPQASNLCKQMYQNKSFKSDLMNSYAWDTAIVYIQKFSGDSDYSYQNSLNTGEDDIATKGTKELEEGKQDKRCNIWDMASNCSEKTTETCSNALVSSTLRGGLFNSYSPRFTCSRSNDTVNNSNNTGAFRPLLIV